MRLIHASRFRAALVLIIVACGRLPVAAIAQEAMQKRMEELVQQLGDDSYRVRERAVEELLKSGLQTKTALFAGMKSREFEIAARCRRLWCEVRIDIGWQHVREVIGDNPKSRDLFDAMFLADPILWYELAETPRPSKEEALWSRTNPQGGRRPGAEKAPQAHDRRSVGAAPGLPLVATACLPRTLNVLSHIVMHPRTTRGSICRGART